MSLALDRTTVVEGPAIVQHDGVNLYSEGDVQLKPNLSTREKKAAIYGKVDEAMLDIDFDVEFTPTELISGHMAKIWPHGSLGIGDSIFGATDKTVCVYSRAGKTVTFKSGAVFKQPSLFLGVDKHPFGSMTYKCIREKGKEWKDANSLYTVASLAWTDPQTFDPDHIYNGVFTGVWADSGAWSSFESEDPFQIDFETNCEARKAQSVGIYDYRVTAMSAAVKAKPIGIAAAIAEAEILDALMVQGTGTARGQSLGGLINNHDLVVANSTASVSFTLKNAAIKSGGLIFGAQLRNGEVGWVATRRLVTGAMSALYALTTPA